MVSIFASGIITMNISKKLSHDAICLKISRGSISINRDNNIIVEHMRISKKSIVLMVINSSTYAIVNIVVHMNNKL